MRLVVTLAAFSISAAVLGAQSTRAQRPPAEWAAGVDLHAAGRPFPHTAIGVRLEHLVPVTPVVGFVIEGSLSTLTSHGVGIACVSDDCDTRQVGTNASAALLLVLGFPSGGRPSVRLGFGRYNAAWGYGSRGVADPHNPDYAPDGPAGWLRQGGLTWNADAHGVPLAVDVAYRWYEDALPRGRTGSELRAGVLLRFGGSRR